MCLLPLPNLNFDSVAYKKGVREFDCGACPECLRKRSNLWALRAVYESRAHSHNCMITLTYDNFIRDSKGRIVGETDVDPDLKVNQRDVQLFIKRLRKWYSTFSDKPIRYIACAEYGSRTHRAHYHLILFGVRFPDLHFYKKSKRGNQIYMSPILSRLWSHGICTVDSVSVRSAVARYCTKYCAKSRSDETFMLCSHHIGLDGLLRDFNGLNYMIDGREYTIPRVVWEHYITSKYSKYRGLINVGNFSPKYVNRDKSLSEFSDDYFFEYSKKQRCYYRSIRDKDPVYVNYLDYWKKRGQLFESLQNSRRQRILQLDDSKFHFYKVSALECYDKRKSLFVPFVAPGSNCISAYCRYVERHWSFAPLSRPNRANDTVHKFYMINRSHPLAKIHFLKGISGLPPLDLFSMQLRF